MNDLDAILAPLHPRSDTRSRFAVLQALTTHWYGPPEPQEPLPPDLAIPSVLRRWYEWAGPNASCMNHQNILLSLAPTHEALRLRVEDGRLYFQMENQGCHFWATETVGDDPAVFGRESWSTPWEAQGCVLSEHLLGAFVFEATLDPDAFTGFTAIVEDGRLDRAVASVPALPIPPWRWPGGLARFHGGHGVLMVAIGSPVGALQVAAKDRQHLAGLADDPAIDWDYRNF